jgi:hypothetical protein
LVLIDGLILGDTPPETVEVLICGFTEEVRSSVWDPRCLQNDALVERIATELPAVWVPPEIDGNCPDPQELTEPTDTFEPDIGTSDTGIQDTAAPRPLRLCASIIPLVVRATWADGTTALGSTRIEIAAQEGETPARQIPPQLTLRVPTTATAGEDVLLEAVFADPTRSRGYQWYVSDGELLKTGITRIQRLEDEQALTDNTLRIPDDYAGPLTVALVANGSQYGQVAVWRTATIEVTP